MKNKEWTPTEYHELVTKLSREIHQTLVIETIRVPEDVQWQVMSRVIGALVSNHYKPIIRASDPGLKPEEKDAK